MEYYMTDDFDVDKIEEKYPELFMQKETLEFQLEQFQKNFDSFKKMYYEAMLIYERKKEQNPNLIPDKVVLQQIKAIETDPAVKEFRQEIDRIKRELKNITTQIDNMITQITKMFEFTEKNCERYLTELNMYYSNTFSFELLMEDIFNNEFNNRMMYYEVAGLRNYPILYMLVEKAPDAWKDLMRMIFEEAHYVYTMEDLQIVSDYPDIISENNTFDNFKLLVLARVKYAEILGEV